MTFAGSTAVGRRAISYAAASNLERTWLELGGKSANVVVPDTDVERAGGTAAWSASYIQGEMCSAGSRLLVHESVHDDAVRAVLATAATTVPGGSYLLATVFDRVEPDQAIAREEIFGPVLAVTTFRDEEEAVRLASGTRYGLAAGAWTNDLGKAHRVSRAMRAGVVWVNCYEEGDLSVPFGGVNESGHGSDRSLRALDRFLDAKTTWMRLAQQRGRVGRPQT
ncbi:MAG TPA: aldehyde dehydrogenase family protein [Acidimicrobiales bacterium]|nr:aldehyde dehydrogenase family protein [Acidimicrobiales bacterium]